MCGISVFKKEKEAKKESNFSNPLIEKYFWMENKTRIIQESGTPMICLASIMSCPFFVFVLFRRLLLRMPAVRMKPEWYNDKTKLCHCPLCENEECYSRAFAKLTHSVVA